jgi:hypothetical protein
MRRLGETACGGRLGKNMRPETHSNEETSLSHTHKPGLTRNEKQGDMFMKMYCQLKIRLLEEYIKVLKENVSRYWLENKVSSDS